MSLADFVHGRDIVGDLVVVPQELDDVPVRWGQSAGQLPLGGDEFGKMLVPLVEIFQEPLRADVVLGFRHYYREAVDPNYGGN